MLTFNISTLLNLKFQRQSQYNRRVCYIIGSLVFFSQAVLFSFYYLIQFVNEKQQINDMYYIIV